MRPDGRADVFGFWISVTAMIGSGLLNALMHKPFGILGVWGAGVAFGIAYSIGFCVLIMGALRVGPTGPTTTINNMALVCGVLYSILWLKPHIPNGIITAGMLGVAVSIVLFGVGGSGSDSEGKLNRQWALMVIPGGLLSGVSFISQTHAGVLYPDNTYLYSFAGFAVSAAILITYTAVGKVNLFRRREMIAGVSVGATMSVTVPLSILVISLVGAEIALPIMVATPIIIVLLLGHFVYEERLQRGTIAACVLGAVSVALLSYGSGK